MNQVPFLERTYNEISKITKFGYEMLYGLENTALQSLQTLYYCLYYVQRNCY